jgi:hypothetical protein
LKAIQGDGGEHPLPAQDERRQRAVAELAALITQRYPTTSFAVGPAEDDPDVNHIAAVVDVDDPDEVLDLVMDRELALQIDEGIPVYVIPIQPPDRSLAAMRRAIGRQQSHMGAAVAYP